VDKTRIDKLAALLRKEGLAGMLVCPSRELNFLTGFTPMMCERFQGLFITAENRCFYFCNRLYQSEIERAYGEAIKTYSWLDGESMTDAVGAVLAEYDLLGKTLGVNDSAQAFNVLDIAKDCGLSFVNGKSLLEEIRIIKTPLEADGLRKSARITDDVFTQVLGFIKPGMKEADISQFLCKKMIEAGGLAPWAIVASGPNSSYPHYYGSGRIIEKQDLIILDFGCSFNKMQSDISRTVFVGGITDEQRMIYNLVLKANEAGEAAAVTGAFIPDVDKAARDIIDNAGYKENFITRLGHGIGYMGHEGPDIKKNNPRNLEPGMAFSIEPGIYIAGKLGVRIEDIVLTTETGNEILNRSRKDIVIICPSSE